MAESKKSFSIFKLDTCEQALKTNLCKYINGMKKLENGAGLHTMVITMVEKPLLKMVLEETSGNQSEAAQILGMSRNTLRRKLAEHKINIRKIRNGASRQSQA